MTGPEHYRQAETHLELAARAPFASIDQRVHLDLARTHAQLANAAATGLNDAIDGLPEFDRDAWQTTAGTPPGGGR